MTISLGRALPSASVRCGSFGRAVRYDRAILLQVGFTRARVTAQLRELLPHDFTLARARSARRYVSVALSFESPRQDVILHPAL